MIKSPNGLEFRAGIECRATGRHLSGLAAVFDRPADLGPFIEVIRPGAFHDTLASRRDIVGLVDHDPRQLLARTASGTLRLAEDHRGLTFDLDLPDTSLGRDIAVLAERGDLGGMSIGFRARQEEWTDRDTHREIRAIDLIEISIAQSWPAYPDTTVAIRSRETIRFARRLTDPRKLAVL